MSKEEKLIHFRLTETMYNLLSKEAEERNITLSEMCRISVQTVIDRGLFIMEPDEDTFVNKMYVHNVKKQPFSTTRIGVIRKAFSELWKDGMRCVIDVDINTI